MLRLAISGCLSILWVLGPAALYAQPAPEFEPGDLIVHFKPEALRAGPANATSELLGRDRGLPAHGDPAARRRAPSRSLHRVASFTVRTQRALTANASLVQLATRTPSATRIAMEALRDDARVAHVEPNYIRRPFIVPNDTHYQLQWNIKAVRLEQAWDMLTGNPDVVVAVVDTGIYHGHPDLAGRVVSGCDFVSDPANAGDNNGWDGDPKDEGTDSLASSALHGTHVAGIIGAASNNSKGIVGVDWACKIQPVRALGIQEGKGNDADIASAIRWAAGVGVPNVPDNKTPARVINLSFGGPGASYLLSDAIKDAQNKGAIVVAAAGNHGGDVQNIYPAVIPGVVTVGATGLDNRRAPYSNYGKEVDIVAPGGNMTQKLPFQYEGKDWYAGIMGTLFNTKDGKYSYQPFEGTSQAAPMVAGIVSLMLRINPTLNAGETANVLRKTASPAGKCNEGCGGGLVDAFAALQATQGGNIEPGPGEKLPFSYQCTNDGECSGGMCRAVSGTQICTQICAADQPCPAGANCVAGLCAPSGSGTYSNNPSTGPTTVWGGGCSLGPSTESRSAAAGLLLLLLLGLALRRRSRRR